MRNVIVIGAGGHGRVVKDIIIASNDKFLGYLDDKYDENNKEIIGCVSDFIKYSSEAEFIIAIGDNHIREKIAEDVLSNKVKYYTAIHPGSIISPYAKINCGTVINPGVIVNAGATIGAHSILNTNSVIEHDNVIEDYVHISPSATLGGTVVVKRCTHIGIGATVKNNINICSNAIIGAGAVVVNNIEESGIYVGVPAKLLNRR